VSLAEYLWLAEHVTGVEADVLAKASRVELAESALHAPQASFAGHEFHVGLAKKAAVLVCRLAWDHPLPDGNKRAAWAAWAALVMFLDFNQARWKPDPPDVDDAEAAMIAIAAHVPPRPGPSSGSVSVSASRSRIGIGTLRGESVGCPIGALTISLMSEFIAWFGFVGAWLLVAGPINQAAIELEDEDFRREDFARAVARTPRPPRVSRWWLLLPPVAYVLHARRARRQQAVLLDALSPSQVEQLMHFRDTASAWLFVASGAALIAVSETWGLREEYEWPAWVFWALIAAMLGVCIANTPCGCDAGRRSSAADKRDSSPTMPADGSLTGHRQRRVPAGPGRSLMTRSPRSSATLRLAWTASC
jgi:prophage maintenance system killer protein